MGYTHYWNQSRDFTVEEWSQIREDFSALFKDIQHVHGIPLANGEGKRRSKPIITDDKIWFNGVGDDAHETFALNRVRPIKESWQSQRGNDFCKTARKPYDLAVVAALCYLATVPSPVAFSVGSDGNGGDFLDGLAEARRALPRYANILDIPMGILEEDRWCMPWVSCGKESGFSVQFCVDGKGYIEKIKTHEYYCFPTHLALAQFLESTKTALFKTRAKIQFGNRVCDEGNTEKNIWNATGTFNEARHARIARAQVKVLKELFPSTGEHAQHPPLYVRPGGMPVPARRAYYFEELLAELNKAA